MILKKRKAGWNRKKISEEHKNYLINNFTQTWEEIEKNVGITRVTIMKWMKELGVSKYGLQDQKAICEVWLMQINAKGKLYVSKETVKQIGREYMLSSFIEKNNFEIKKVTPELHVIQLRINY